MSSPWHRKDFNKPYPPKELRELGACANEGPRVFYPEEGENYSEAMFLCTNCDVREMCGEWAIANHEHGCWGGTTAHDRKLIRQNRNRPRFSFRPIEEHGNGKRSFMAHINRGELPCVECVEGWAIKSARMSINSNPKTDKGTR